MSCKRCGQCCFPYSLRIDYDPEVYRWFSYHGAIVQQLGDKHMAILSHSKCGMLVFNEDGTTGCAVYPDRPAVCREYVCERAKNGH